MNSRVEDAPNLEGDLLDIVASEAMLDRDALTRDAMLEDLNIASADFVMVLMAIEEKYGVYISVDNELADVKTVQNLLDLAVKKITEADT